MSFLDPLLIQQPFSDIHSIALHLIFYYTSFSSSFRGENLYEVILDFTNISTIYAFYASFLLSLTIKYIWTWHIEYDFIEAACASSSKVNLTLSTPSILQIYEWRSNSILGWIARSIRRKESSGDDSEGFHSFS